MPYARLGTFRRRSQYEAAMVVMTGYYWAIDAGRAPADTLAAAASAPPAGFVGFGAGRPGRRSLGRMYPRAAAQPCMSERATSGSRAAPEWTQPCS